MLEPLDGKEEDMRGGGGLSLGKRYAVQRRAWSPCIHAARGRGVSTQITWIQTPGGEWGFGGEGRGGPWKSTPMENVPGLVVACKYKARLFLDALA